MAKWVGIIDILADYDPDGLTAEIWYRQGGRMPYYVYYKDTETGHPVYHISFKTEKKARKHAMKATNKIEVTQ